MARGFESKQVEDQQAEAERRRALREAGEEPKLDAAREAKKRSLELAQVDARRRLDAATAAPLRAMLERTLAAIDAELQKLG
jgi:hypothetical protein